MTYSCVQFSIFNSIKTLLSVLIIIKKGTSVLCFEDL